MANTEPLTLSTLRLACRKSRVSHAKALRAIADGKLNKVGFVAQSALFDSLMVDIVELKAATAKDYHAISTFVEISPQARG